MKRAFVSGGARGIGKATCLMLAKNKYDIVFNYKSNEEEAKNTENEIKKFGVSVKSIKLDMIHLDLVYDMINKEIEENGSFEVLVFNAAIRKDALFTQMKKEEWGSVIDVNLKSFYYLPNHQSSLYQ
jgi:3-oxoacyl-[acyl-carrier protein] reductase